VKGVETAQHKNYILALVNKLTTPLDVVEFVISKTKKIIVVIDEEDEGVKYARAKMNYDAHQEGMEALRVQGVNNAHEDPALRDVAPPLRAADDAAEGVIEDQDNEYFEEQGADFMQDEE
jgi:hypothetical protein